MEMNGVHVFEIGDECPFCVEKLELINGELKCHDEECFFNKVVWEKV